MITSFKLWLVRRQIAHMERHEEEVAANLRHIRCALLPKLREKRNRLMYGPTPRAALPRAKA